jgi:hypothetical protein
MASSAIDDGYEWAIIYDIEKREVVYEVYTRAVK